MDIKIEQRANRTVVHCADSLDAPAALTFSETVKPLVVNGEAPIVLDMSAVPSIGSEGVNALRLLFEAAEECQTGVGNEGPPLLRLANLPPAVQQILEESGFNERMAGWPGDHGGTTHTYRALLSRVRCAFPSPVSDPLHDAYFVQSVAQALDRVDGFKNDRPYLGEPLPLDYEAARRVQPPEEMATLEEVIHEVADYLQGHVNWGHPHTQEQVIPPSTIASIIGQMFGAIYNPNLLWDAYSHRVAQAEIELAAMCAALVGYDPARSAGVSTFGDTGTELYGVKLGLEKAQPGAFRTGVHGGLRVVASDASHYSRLNVAAWLGLGTEALLTVATDNDNSMSLPGLEVVLRGVFARGKKVACIIATVDTTDAFGLDNVEAIVRLRDALADEYRLPYRPHVHADAVIGWPWAVFNDYDFAANPLGFPPRTLRSLWDARAVVRCLPLADSIGIDFHKTGYGPMTSSLFLCKERADLELIARDLALMPYLFQFGGYRPGVYTLETSRGGGAVLAALANFKLLGKEGYRVRLGHIVSMAETLRAKLEHAPHARIINDYNHGMVTLFRVYPDGVDANAAYQEESTHPEKASQLDAHNAYNRRVFDALRRQVADGEGVSLGLTDRYRLAPSGLPIVALKSFVMSPFVDEKAMNHLLICLERARREAA